MTDEDDDMVLAMLAEQTGAVAEFDSLAEALDHMRRYLDPDGIVEVHEDGCNGGDDCGCNYLTLTAAELMPSAKA